MRALYSCRAAGEALRTLPPRAGIGQASVRIAESNATFETSKLPLQELSPVAPRWVHAGVLPSTDSGPE